MLLKREDFLFFFYCMQMRHGNDNSCLITPSTRWYIFSSEWETACRTGSLMNMAAILVANELSTLRITVRCQTDSAGLGATTRTHSIKATIAALWRP